jgi:hypothetical protein
LKSNVNKKQLEQFFNKTNLVFKFRKIQKWIRVVRHSLILRFLVISFVYDFFSILKLYLKKQTSSEDVIQVIIFITLTWKYVFLIKKWIIYLEKHKLMNECAWEHVLRCTAYESPEGK